MKPINIFSDIQTVTDEWTTPMSHRMFHTWENGPESQSLVTREEIKGKIIPTANLLHHIRMLSTDHMGMFTMGLFTSAPIKNHLYIQLWFYTYDAELRKRIQGFPHPIDHENGIIPLQP